MLTNQEVIALNWELDGKFKYPNLVRIRTIPDGSCLFHAIIKAFFKPYIIGYLDGKPLDRSQFVRDLRKELSELLDKPAVGGKTYYQLLARGNLEAQANDKTNPMREASLEAMKEVLNSYEPVNELFDEFISNVLDKDIYMLDSKTKDIYMHPDRNSGLLYKNRQSIILLDLHGHYELIGVMRSGKIYTHFDANDSLILSIKQRMDIFQST